MYYAVYINTYVDLNKTFLLQFNKTQKHQTMCKGIQQENEQKLFFNTTSDK